MCKLVIVSSFSRGHVGCSIGSFDNLPLTDLKGVAKLLDRLNVHKASGPDGLNARVLKE